MTKTKYRITLTEEMLGCKPSSAQVFTDFVAVRKAEVTPADEISAAELAEQSVENLEKGMTVFHRADDGKTPIMWDYEWKGFFKDAVKALRRDPKSESAKVKAYKSVIDGNIFVSPRRIELRIPEGQEMGICERPLRAQTQLGERVALAKSETVPEGTTMEIEIALINPEYGKLVQECLEYGALKGIGQWRNSGKGRFTFEKIEA